MFQKTFVPFLQLFQTLVQSEFFVITTTGHYFAFNQRFSNTMIVPSIRVHPVTREKIR